MNSRCRLRFRFLKSVLAACIALQAVSCGTIFHPERRGQPAGRLDPAIVALDAVGLLFFFVPGVVAFAVDFSNGTIYLPPEEYSGISASEGGHGDWTPIEVDADDITADKITEVIRRQTGKTISLQPGTYRVERVEPGETFAQIAAALEAEASPSVAGPNNVVRFRCQSE